VELQLREQILNWLADNVSPQRLQHILGVEQMCIELASCYGLNQQQAAIAGLMHDLAKFFSAERLLAIAQTEKIPIDSISTSHPHLLHADVSAILAKKEFGIEDEEILAAIRNHTLGSPHMSQLSCVVFVADALEPNRGNTQDLVAMRPVAQKNLYKSVQQTCDYSLKYLISNYKIIHPRVILTRNWALAKIKEQSTKTGNQIINQKKQIA
jgi:predicted HD superfamily hydrolase involved in NAD metabolism